VLQGVPGVRRRVEGEGAASRSEGPRLVRVRVHLKRERLPSLCNPL
jgi:hypothetical protein